MNLLRHLIRPDDLLNLWIETDNLRLDQEPGGAGSGDGEITTRALANVSAAGDP